MRLQATRGIDAPRPRVHAALADFAGIEAGLASRGWVLTREPPGPPRPGTAWAGSVEWKGMRRNLAVTLDAVDPPEGYRLTGRSDGVDALVSVALSALSEVETTARVTVELTARSLSGRMLVQSLRLAKGGMEARLEARLAAWAAEIEAAERGAPTPG